MQPFRVPPLKAAAGKYLVAGASARGITVNPRQDGSMPFLGNNSQELLQNEFRHMKRTNLGIQMWKCPDSYLIPNISHRHKDIKTLGAHPHTSTLPEY